ncbi:MAG: hypothetical protein QNJ65_10270 [Xenococcaceae cyanobacterium MO_234.B1]|nr:hypothetical protein [Xenococcaceae cyanobacterium MO_234.B1]
MPLVSEFTENNTLDQIHWVRISIALARLWCINSLSLEGYTYSKEDTSLSDG